MKGCIEVYEDIALVTEDMNARVGESEVECIVAKFGVSEMNENGRKLFELQT